MSSKKEEVTAGGLREALRSLLNEIVRIIADFTNQSVLHHPVEVRRMVNISGRLHLAEISYVGDNIRLDLTLFIENHGLEPLSANFPQSATLEISKARNIQIDWEDNIITIAR